MGLNLQYEYGQTPLDPEELDELKIHSISTKAELDELEQQNIEEALFWAMGLKFAYGKLISEKFVLDLHKRMYKNVWKWAGTYRITEKNIGVKQYMITHNLRNLLDDTLYWIKNQTYSPHEIAIRFKHRLVSIHCFPNGNGRHSRLMADIIMEKIFKLPPFTWGRNQVTLSKEQIRKEYINAVRAADLNDYQPLLHFSQS
ncbi:mobile mystery protein B [Sphingobacterium cavernae]|uniref:mobile mystery protein B n=1 Tax=Sphingobacterium cavernae TaxID=2592657 RepID=UPI00122FB64F|nr:mobile mystery protein B [Sphingobacterium cavernae]